jgi:hypothetical protein
MLHAELGTKCDVKDFFQASNYEGVEKIIEMISNYLQSYGKPTLKGEPQSYERMKKVADFRNEEYTRRVVTDPIRKSADEAWKKHDYAKVEILYESLGEYLSPLELKRLEYVKRRT